MPKPPVSNPSPTPAGDPPSGATGATAPCCPDVATFELATPRMRYFAFDDTTNGVAVENQDEYWVGPTKEKTLPADRETRDGARWVSVGTGQETEVMIHFDGTFTAACLANCRYEFEPANLAEVTSPAATRSGVSFKIKGNRVGEGSLKVMCDGKLRGYFHIWCVHSTEIDVDIGCLVTPLTKVVSYDVGAVSAYLNEVFRQALITINLHDKGIIRVNPSFNTYSVMTEEAKVPLEELDKLAMAQNWGWQNSKYRLYYYVRNNGPQEKGGSVLKIGTSGPGFVFHDKNMVASHFTLAHELGHLLNLDHPTYDFVSDQDEFPSHQFQSLIPALNILGDDPENLMGYIGPAGPNSVVSTTLRYRQWKKLNRR